MTDISVIVPTYNSSLFISKTLKSIINQTLKPYEVIIIDDGSNDGTKDWVKESFQDIRYIYQKNQGVSSARNKGIKYACGDWVAFLDSDDEWLPNKLYEQVKAIGSNPEIKFFHTNEIWFCQWFLDIFPYPTPCHHAHIQGFQILNNVSILRVPLGNFSIASTPNDLAETLSLPQQQACLGKPKQLLQMLCL